MPEDNRDFRITCDLCFPPEKEGVARGLINHLVNQIDKAINIYVDAPYQELGFCALTRCGHRINESCEIIERHEVE